MTDDHGLTRRMVLISLGAFSVVAAGGLAAAPGTAHGQTLGQNESVEEALKRLFGGKTIKDGSAAIKLDVPLIAENGAVVPVSGTVDSPMTPTSWVKQIYVVADKNRIPVVTRVALAPDAGRPLLGANHRRRG